MLLVLDFLYVFQQILLVKISESEDFLPFLGSSLLLWREEGDNIQDWKYEHYLISCFSIQEEQQALAIEKKNI